MANDALPARKDSPIVFLTVALLLNSAVLVWLGWYSYSSFQKSRVTRERDFRIEQLRGRIVHLDEVLTMSARMAAATGDPRWEQRYRGFEPKLDAAIKEAIELAPEAYSGEAAAQTDAANIRLVEMENRAFELVRRGRAEQARGVLFSDEYEKQKQIYAQGMIRFAHPRYRYLRLAELRGTIVHLDEVLTMSARMAAATGDLRWEKRYRGFEPKLDVAIKEAIQLAPEAHSGEAAAKTDAANIRLVEMENRAFDMVRRGETEQAATLLFGDDYEAQKRVYADGMTEFAAGLSAAADRTLADQQRQVFLYIAAVALLIPLVAVGWFVVFRATQNWQRLVGASNRRLCDQAEELAQLNCALDQKVALRTWELDEANKGLEAEIADRERAQEELNDRMLELERFNHLAVGREQRMIELKREVNEMARKAGAAPPYDLSFAEDSEPAPSARLE